MKFTIVAALVSLAVAAPTGPASAVGGALDLVTGNIPIVGGIAKDTTDTVAGAVDDALDNVETALPFGLGGIVKGYADTVGGTLGGIGGAVGGTLNGHTSGLSLGSLLGGRE